MPITWPKTTLPPINQPVLMPALEFYEMINKGDKMTIEQELDELRQQIAGQYAILDRQYQIQERQKQQYEALLESFEKQQKQLDVAMKCIFSLQEKVGRNEPYGASNVFGTLMGK